MQSPLWQYTHVYLVSNDFLICLSMFHVSGHFLPISSPFSHTASLMISHSAWCQVHVYLITYMHTHWCTYIQKNPPELPFVQHHPALVWPLPCFSFAACYTWVWHSTQNSRKKYVVRRTVGKSRRKKDVAHKKTPRKPKWIGNNFKHTRWQSWDGFRNIGHCNGHTHEYLVLSYSYFPSNITGQIINQ